MTVLTGLRLADERRERTCEPGIISLSGSEQYHKMNADSEEASNDHQDRRHSSQNKHNQVH